MGVSRHRAGPRIGCRVGPAAEGAQVAVSLPGGCGKDGAQGRPSGGRSQK